MHAQSTQTHTHKKNITHDTNTFQNNRKLHTKTGYIHAYIRPNIHTCIHTLSNTLNASSISSSESVSFILRAMSVRNSGKSMVPLPSASTWGCMHHHVSVFLGTFMRYKGSKRRKETILWRKDSCGFTLFPRRADEAWPEILLCLDCMYSTMPTVYVHSAYFLALCVLFRVARVTWSGRRISFSCVSYDIAIPNSRIWSFQDVVM